MIYVVSDLHGCLKEFSRMLIYIGFKQTDQLYVIGDVIDRGPSPIKLLRLIMDSPNMYLILGNHELMMRNSICNPCLDKKEKEKFMASDDAKSNRAMWLKYGGVITERQYMKLGKPEKMKIYDYLQGLPMLQEINIKDKDYILIHGGVYEGFAEDYGNGTVSDNILWNFFPSLSRDDEIMPGKTFVFGHTPTSEYGYDNEIISIGDKHLIDCGCVFGYSLGCLRLDDEECFYVSKY